MSRILESSKKLMLLFIDFSTLALINNLNEELPLQILNIYIINILTVQLSKLGKKKKLGCIIIKRDGDKARGWK